MMGRDFHRTRRHMARWLIDRCGLDEARYWFAVYERLDFYFVWRDLYGYDL